MAKSIQERVLAAIAKAERERNAAAAKAARNTPEQVAMRRKAAALRAAETR